MRFFIGKRLLVLFFLSFQLLSRSAQAGIFGHSENAKSFLALCKRSPETLRTDDRKIISRLRVLTASSDCEEAWKRLKTMEYLNLSQMDLRDISALEMLKYPKVINLDDNLLNDVRALNKLSSLTEISLKGNCLQSLFSFRAAANLLKINLTGNALTSPALSAENFPSGVNIGLRIIEGTQFPFPNKPSCAPYNTRPALPPSRIPAYLSVAATTALPGVSRNHNSQPLPLVPIAVQRNPPPPPVEPPRPIIISSEATTAKLINQQLATIKEHGIIFKSAIMMEEINTYEALKAAYAELGQTRVNENEYLNSLYQVSSLLEELKSTSKPARAFASLDQWRINDRVFLRKIYLRTFSSRIEELHRQGRFTDEFYLKFYTLIIKDPRLIEQSSFPEGEQANLDRKIDYLILLFAAIKQSDTGSSQQRHLSGGVVSFIPEQYNSSGQRPEWYRELQFKLFKLFQVYPTLTASQQSDLISYFLHGGRHCNDAKWHAINDAFKRFCPYDAEALANDFGGDIAHERPLEALVQKSIAAMKIDKLTAYINDFIDRGDPLSGNRSREYCSVFNATWDRLAPVLGLPRVGSNYHMEMVDAEASFNGFYRQNFTVKLVSKKSTAEILEYLKKSYFGTLMELTSDPDRLVLMVLAYFEFIS